MSTRLSNPLLLPLLTLGLTFALVTTVRAEDRDKDVSRGASATLQVNFGSSPHWAAIGRTHIDEVRASERPGYDLFRYGGSYYAYTNDRWYRSPRESGEFTAIEPSAVPAGFARIPRDHWRSYPTTWQNASAPGSDEAPATFQVTFGARPHWASIGETRIEEISAAERPDYDMFRFGGSYYAYNDGQWYVSTNESGEFTAIDDDAVPADFSAIPREHWRSYPAAFADAGDDGPDEAPATFQVSFNAAPHWASIGETRIDEISAADRPDYDMFRFGGSYYAYIDDQWYVSTNESGEFTAIDDDAVPADFSAIPREHWRSYPAAYADAEDQGPDDMSATLQVTIGNSPHWTGIRGTKVDEISGSQRPAFDIFRYAGSYYAYSDGRWFSSPRENGAFARIPDGAVPTAFANIPHNHWRNYPKQWLDSSGNIPQSDQRLDGSGHRDDQPAGGAQQRRRP